MPPTTSALRRRALGLALAVGLSGALASCTTGTPRADDGELPTATSSPRPTTAATGPTPSPTTSPTPSGSSATPTKRPEPSGDRGPGPSGVSITVPPAGVDPVGPVVVLVHGGGWLAGSPALLDRWATALAAEGAVVFNASYAFVLRGGGYPSTVDDVACAVRFARAEAPAYTAAQELVIVGHSAGGHLAAVVALDPEPWGGDCAYPPADPPDRLVGLAGIYDVRPFRPAFDLFVGSSGDIEARLSAVNPVELAPRQGALEVVLITGGQDEIVPPSQAASFAAALPDGATVRELDDADHNALQNPDVVGLAEVLGK